MNNNDDDDDDDDGGTLIYYERKEGSGVSTKIDILFRDDLALACISRQTKLLDVKIGRYMRILHVDLF